MCRKSRMHGWADLDPFDGRGFWPSRDRPSDLVGGRCSVFGWAFPERPAGGAWDASGVGNPSGTVTFLYRARAPPLKQAPRASAESAFRVVSARRSFYSRATADSTWRCQR